tara:strand:- start:1494 stop:2216 length:723 start_codon:yes stop_codon:yes gene_type:complete
MDFLKNLINLFLKKLNFKLIRVVDQFSNSYRLVLSFKEKEIDYILDVGANEGQFVKELRFYGYEGNIISFEPILDAHKRLLQNSLKDDKWEIYKPIALGNKNRESVINISKNSVSSSIFEMKKEHLENAPNSMYVSKQSINEIRLEEIFFDLDLKEKNLFLKIDTQGYEYEVLKGAEEILKYFKGIMVEVSLTNLYEGQKSWQEILGFIQSKGFNLWSIDRGFSNKKNGKTLQVDMCFFK